MKTITKREQEILYHLYPAVLLPLIRAGVIKPEDIGDIKRVQDIVCRKRKFAVARMELGISIELHFAEHAVKAWKDGERDIAIVLLATAIEQTLNGTLRLIIESKGLRKDHVTQLIRSQNIEEKTTWFFKMYSGKKFPKKLFRQIKKISDIRNMIVHFKAVMAHPDKEEDSYSKITKSISSLGKFQIRTFFDNYWDYCMKVIREADPSIDLALRITNKIIAEN